MTNRFFTKTTANTRPNTRTVITIVSTVLLASLLAGCQTTPVAAWEKGVLAEPAMSPKGLAQYNAVNTHVYTSKETARGGDGVAGGGCGCN